VRPPAALFALALLLAGCASPPAPPPEDGMAVLGSALVSFHDHADPALHPGAAWRMHDVWDSTLPMNATGSASPPSEFAIWGHFAFVSLFHPSAGFVVLDLADPEHPRQLGYYDAGTAYTNDVEVSADGHWAFVPTQPHETAENDAADGGPVYYADRGVQAVDVSDPARPRMVAFFDATAGGQPPATPLMLPSLPTGSGGWHRLDVETIAGAIYVFGTDNEFARIDILRFDTDPVPRFVPVGAYQSPQGRQAALDRSDGSNSYNIHDVTVGPDPLDPSRTLMAVAHWRAGVHFVDVSDPAHPVLLGTWDKFVEVLPGNVHNVEFTAIEGHRVAVAVPEYPTDFERQGILWILDATDFADVRLLGTWQLPGLHPAEGGVYMFSTDRTEIRNGTIYVPHFHAGLVVLDASSLAKAAHPELLGFVIPHGRTAIPYAGYDTNPVVYDAVPYGPYVYYSDLLGAFHVARADYAASA
jgi:hypothetical protein